MFAAERIHADDTTVPVVAKGKTRTGVLLTVALFDGQRSNQQDDPKTAP